MGQQQEAMQIDHARVKSMPMCV